MEKTKDMILIEKLHRATRRMHPGRPGGAHRGGKHFGPGAMPGMMSGMMPGMPPFPQGPHPGKPGGPGRPGMFPRERILTVLLEADENGLKQRDIAEQLGIHAPAMTEQIDRLEAEHYLERCANPDDRRSTLVKLTEKGRARAYEVSDERKERAAAFTANLSEEEKDTLIALLDKLMADPED